MAKESIAEVKTQLRNDVRLRLTTILFNQMAPGYQGVPNIMLLMDAIFDNTKGRRWKSFLTRSRWITQGP